MGVQGMYPLEVRERAVRLVFEQQGGHDSQWETIVSVAAKIGCGAETLRKWCGPLSGCRTLRSRPWTLTGGAPRRWSRRTVSSSRRTRSCGRHHLQSEFGLQ